MRSIVRMPWAGLLAFIALSGAVQAQSPNEVDPFARPAPTSAPKKEPATAKYITFQVSVAPKEVRRGETFQLSITGEPLKGNHTYPITQRAAGDAQDDSQLTKLTYEDAPGLKPLWPIRETEPTWVEEPRLGAFLELKQRFTWSQDVLVLPNAAPGAHILRFKLKVQVCEDLGSCRTGVHEFTVPVQVSDADPLPLSAALKGRLEDKQPPIKVVATPPRAAPGPAAGPDAGVTTLRPANQTTLWGLLLASMGAAIAMLFTPCVFPMVPITVSFFLKQAEKEHHKPVLTAGVYSLTIIVVLALAVLVLGKLIVDLANNAWLNLGLGAVLIFFALSLFGMYEIELPNFLARFTASREGRGGFVGAFFMALTFTITSFTCTGPFLGPLLVTAKEFQLSFDRLLVASFAYSATFAAPFFVMALFPSLLKKLPRSGGWLNNVKVVMGFLELAAALKFLGNMDVALNPGNARIFTFETVLCAWIALSAACGLYLLGVFRLPHDTPVESVGVPRMILATIFLGLALYMVPALFRKVPEGIIGEGLYAFLPLDTAEQAARGGAAAADASLDWHLDYQKAWTEATTEDKPIFIDFTGVNCTNCRANENRIFPQKEVRDQLAKFVRVQLYTDSVPRRGLTPAEAVAEAERNKQLQDRMFHDVSTPMYVVFYPDKTHPFDGDRLSGRVADPNQPVFSGYIRDTADFVNFLKNGHHRQVAQESGG